MRIFLHIGLPHTGATRLQSVLAAKRAQLAKAGALFPRAGGKENHTRLFMAVTEPGHVDPLRFNRGFVTPDAQAALRDGLADDLAAEIKQHDPETLILSATQLGASLVQPSELERLKAMLTPHSSDIRIVAHVDAQDRLLARHYAAQVMEGRTRGLDLELSLAGKPDWWQACLAEAPRIAPRAGQFFETQTPPFWLDYERLIAHWEAVFGAGSLTLRAYLPDLFFAQGATEEIRAAFEIDAQIGKADAEAIAPEPSAATLSRARQFNALLMQVLQSGQYTLPGKLWRTLLGEMAVPGDPLDPRSLSRISGRFAEANARLAARYNLPETLFEEPTSAPDWTETDPSKGFRASQYLLRYRWRIERASRQAEKAVKMAQPAPNPARGQKP